IWVAATGGLHRFRELAVPTLTARQGLPDSRASAFLASPDGAVWMSTTLGLVKATDAGLSIYRQPASIGKAADPRASRSIRYVDGAGLPDGFLHAVFRDGRGRVWVASEQAVGYLEGDRFVKASGVPASLIRGITGDAAGAVWIASQQGGLFR